MSAPAEEMSCRELVEVITDYVEGTMAPVDRVRFEAHLGECPYCVAYLEQMRETIAAIGGLTEDSIDSRARGELIAAFRGWHGR